MLLHRHALQLARAVDVDRLDHRLEPDARVGLAVLSLDRVDRRAGEEQHVLGDPLRFEVLEVEDDVALVERTGAGDHRGVDARRSAA